MNRFFTICAILAIVFAAFYPTLKSGFVNWDDDKVLTENLAIRFLDAAHVKDLFTGTALNTYAPLTMLTYAVVVTVIAVIAAIWIGSVAEKHKSA